MCAEYSPNTACAHNGFGFECFPQSANTGFFWFTDKYLLITYYGSGPVLIPG